MTSSKPSLGPALACLGRARTLDPERDLVLSLIAGLEGRDDEA